MLFDAITQKVFSNWILIICFFAAMWIMAEYNKRRSKGALPGPWGLPILGVAPFVGFRQELTYTKWARKYGDVLGFKVGSSYTVVLSSYDAIQEAFVKNQAFFNERPDNYVFKDAMHKLGIGAADYTPEYISRRKFSRDVLGRLGFGKTTMENSILDEVDSLIQQFAGEKVPLNEKTKEMIAFRTGNILFQVTIGKRYDSPQDPEFRAIIKGTMDFFHDGAYVFAAALVFPFIATSLPVIRGKALGVKNSFVQLCEVVMERIEEHAESLSESSTRDLIDEYLLEMKRTGNKILYSKEVLTYIIRDFFVGGMETVQVTMIYCFLVLANRPAVMKKVHEEIDEVLGSEGKPRYAMREKMTFCHAVIKEIMRFRTVTPLLVPHSTSENVTFHGCLIPKGATILPNVYAVHNDPRNWKKPEEFNPERHLDASGKVDPSKYFIPFGLGPRACPGRQLAEMELFIFFVRIFQRYDVIPTPTPECKRPHVKDDAQFTGLTALPPYHTPVTLIPRVE